MKVPAPKLQLALACLITMTLALAAPALGEFKNPKAGKPPEAKPQRISAAEGIPPLPLPATPLRRSEKKKQPAPPALVGMINFSAKVTVSPDGQAGQDESFPTTQIDIERLMNFANSRLNIRYRFIDTSLAGFSFDPTELPVLYLTGWTAMPELSDATVEKLRRYLYDGGTLVLHAQCGRHEFTDSARREVARILPNRQLAPLDGDSPLFHACYDLAQMRVRKGTDDFRTIPPYLEGVYLGCRPAIIFSPIDLNCGWDVQKYPIEGSEGMYHQDDALLLGVNILATSLANFQYARAWGTEKIYHEQEDKTRDQLVIAQVVHGGDWDPTPHALPNLMKYVAKNTTLNVQFKRETTDLANVDVFKHPVLYMTGLRDFKLSGEQATQLKNYLASGGILIADSATGSVAFDQAFRREIKKALPDAANALKTLPPDSAIYQMPFAIRAVQYSELVKSQQSDLTAPTLEGITIDGQLAVIYSPLSLSNGWEQMNFAYTRGYEDADALRLGVNILSYAVTH